MTETMQNYTHRSFKDLDYHFKNSSGMESQLSHRFSLNVQRNLSQLQNYELTNMHSKVYQVPELPHQNFIFHMVIFYGSQQIWKKGREKAGNPKKKKITWNLE